MQPLAVDPSTGGDHVQAVSALAGQTPRPDIEHAILEKVGSYGRQLGRIGDALEVLPDHMKLKDLNDRERDALAVLRGQLTEIRQVKQEGQ